MKLINQIKCITRKLSCNNVSLEQENRWLRTRLIQNDYSSRNRLPKKLPQIPLSEEQSVKMSKFHKKMHILSKAWRFQIKYRKKFICTGKMCLSKPQIDLLVVQARIIKNKSILLVMKNQRNQIRTKVAIYSKLLCQTWLMEYFKM